MRATDSTGTLTLNGVTLTCLFGEGDSTVMTDEELGEEVVARA